MDIMELERLLESHDWWFEHSDDQRAWSRGIEQKLKIIEALAELPTKEMVALVSVHAPEQFRRKYINEVLKKSHD